MSQDRSRPRSVDHIGKVEVVRRYAPDIAQQAQALLLVLAWVPPVVGAPPAATIQAQPPGAPEGGATQRGGAR
jgi:hypothetical protein